MTEYIRIGKGEKVHIIEFVDGMLDVWSWCGLYGIRLDVVDEPPSSDHICKHCLKLSELHKVNK